MHLLLDCCREKGSRFSCTLSLTGSTLGFPQTSALHSHAQWTAPRGRDGFFSAAPNLLLLNFQSCVHSSLVCSNFNNAPCWSVKVMHYAEKHILWPIEPWLLAYLEKCSSRASPQGVVTWQWLALWHRPSTLNVNQTHKHTYIEKLLIWQYVSLHTWLMNACTGVSFMKKKRVWDTRVKQRCT